MMAGVALFVCFLLDMAYTYISPPLNDDNEYIRMLGPIGGHKSLQSRGTQAYWSSRGPMGVRQLDLFTTPSNLLGHVKRCTLR